MSVIWRVPKSGLKLPFRYDVDKLLDESPWPWVVTYGYRSLEEQKALYDIYLAGGAKAAPPGKSPHNFGLAVDVALDGEPAPGLQPDWVLSHPGWVWLFDAVFDHPRLHSGRDFGDSDHIEAVNWKALR